MIRFEGVHKTYGGEQPLHVLKGVDLTISEGELVSIVGPSGSGKSTLLNIIGLLDDFDKGVYYLDGIQIKNQTEKEKAAIRNKYIGFVFQSYNLINSKNALENVTIPLLFKGIGRKQRNEEGLKYLEMMGLESHWNHLPSQMSGGQQQRVAIARALIGNPKIILADEPTGALDSNTGQEVMNILKSINKTYGHTIVIVTHEPAIANQADRKIVFKDGLIIEDVRIG